MIIHNSVFEKAHTWKTALIWYRRHCLISNFAQSTKLLKFDMSRFFTWNRLQFLVLLQMKSWPNPVLDLHLRPRPPGHRLWSSSFWPDCPSCPWWRRFRRPRWWIRVAVWPFAGGILTPVANRAQSKEELLRNRGKRLWRGPEKGKN